MKLKLLIACVLVASKLLVAQDLSMPGAYMNALSNAHKEMDQKYMAYTSATAHGKRARKVEKLRLQVLESITNSKYNVGDIPNFKGDNSLRQSLLEYINFCYTIFNDDYSKLVNTEELAEESFDEMQAHILMKEKIDEKLTEANTKINKAVKDFADKYKVTLTEGKDNLGEKIAKANSVGKYYKPIYLIFFKCNWQDNAMVKALNNKKINDAEQARTSIIKFANEGLANLKSIVNYEGDGSLLIACKEALLGFKSIAEVDAVKIIEFNLQKESYDKIKAAFDAKPQSDRTKEDVENINKAVKTFNNAVNVSNEANNVSNKKRSEVFDNWEKTVKTFFDTYTPYYK
jgi:hypothetical protein